MKTNASAKANQTTGTSRIQGPGPLQSASGGSKGKSRDIGDLLGRAGCQFIECIIH
jgi:hypothetical protein